MKGILLATALVLTNVALAQETAGFQYKCHATTSDGFFYDGFVLLSVTKTKVKLDYYYVNTVAHETSLDYSAMHDVDGPMGGNGKLAGYIVLPLKKVLEPKHYMGDPLSPLYLEPELFKGGKLMRNGKKGGFFAFSGHGYSYDWNVCFAR